ncbi:MAG: hypothetical protein WBW87_11160 [Candidatus Cybelea sp.]
MNLPGLVKNASSLAALAICAACSGGSAGAPSTAPLNYQYVGRTLFVNGRPVTAARLSATPRYETIVPDRHRRLKHFEYVFNFYGSYASIFNYPKSTAMIGQLNGAGGQGCTNVLYGYGKKIFWNPGRRGELIDEYQVPQKLLRSLTLDYTITSSCAMNTSGDLAVGILLGNSYGSGGQVAIFKNATGTPTVYKTPLTEEFFDGYDPKGNLFADGFGPSSFMLVELPKGSSKAVMITTSNAPEFPGSVQWDGTYLSVFDQLTSETYQYAVSGTTATLKNTIQYSGVGDCAQTWIVKGMLYCGDAENGGEVFNYPAGGAPIAQFTGSFDSPLGVVAVKNK